MAKNTTKKVKKSAVMKMVEVPIEQDDQEIRETTIENEDVPVEVSPDIQPDVEVSLLKSEIDELNGELALAQEKIKILERDNESLKTEIAETKENAKKLNTLFESYEIEFLKTENEVLKAELEKYKRAAPARRNSGIMTPTNGYEYW